MEWSTEVYMNFSFKKLAANIGKPVIKLLDDLAEASAETTKANIDKGLSPLRPATIEARRAGKYWGNQRGDQYKTDSTTPLKHTGSLYKSIKAKKGRGMQLNKYGLNQHKGFTAGKGIVVKPRPFISALSTRSRKSTMIIRKFFINIGRQMRKGFKFSGLPTSKWS